MATLKDVAKEAGLTVSTVSRVLNNRGYISDEARTKVQEAMQKLHYQPNEVARSLSKKKTNTIGVIVPHIRHPFFADLISNLENQAAKKGYKILLCNSRDKGEKEMAYIDMCTSNQVSGVILCSGTVEIDSLRTLDIPLVTIERYLENGTTMVECNNRQGGALAAQVLIQAGCRNLLQLSGLNETAMPADERAIGFEEACRKRGISCTEVKTSSIQYNAQEYHEFINKVLEEHTEADGIFASSDLIAAQILQVCYAKKIRVPEDLKIVGFDDVNIASLTTPRITTIHQPIKEMAETAVDLLIKASSGKMVPTRSMLPVSLVVRETT